MESRIRGDPYKTESEKISFTKVAEMPISWGPCPFSRANHRERERDFYGSQDKGTTEGARSSTVKNLRTGSSF